MNVYRFTGWGRRRGAIGIFHAFTCTVAAENEDKARLYVYNHYDHILGGASGLKLLEVKPSSQFPSDAHEG